MANYTIPAVSIATGARSTNNDYTAYLVNAPTTWECGTTELEALGRMVVRLAVAPPPVIDLDRAATLQELLAELTHLRKYARHLPTCVAGAPCTCGFEERAP
jgi:hypothetical protein